MRRQVEQIPSWAINAIINDDCTGLEYSEIDLIQRWFKDTGYDYVCTPDSDPYFTNYPAFGLPCDVYDCICVTL